VHGWNPTRFAARFGGFSKAIQGPLAARRPNASGQTDPVPIIHFGNYIPDSRKNNLDAFCLGLARRINPPRSLTKVRNGIGDGRGKEPMFLDGWDMVEK
jgi:hypothetical protein